MSVMLDGCWWPITRSAPPCWSTITIPDGETAARIVIPIREDLAVEGNETFTVNLHSADYAAIATPTVTVTIVDGDAGKPPVVDTIPGNRRSTKTISPGDS